MRNKTLECTINDYAKYWPLADFLNAPSPKGDDIISNNMASEYQRVRFRHLKIISKLGLNPLTLFAVLS